MFKLDRYTKAMNKDIDFRTLVPDAYRHQGPVSFEAAQYTTTSHIYDNIPMSWDGGDLGQLAVDDIANRILRRGATPRYFSANLFIDEDTDVAALHRMRESMRQALTQAEMECVNIHTSVLQSGPRFGVAMSCFGVGVLPPDLNVGASCIEPDDIVIVTGNVGAHGLAVGIASGVLPKPEEPIVDTPASLGDIVHSLLRDAPGLRALVLPMRADGLMGALKRAAKRSYTAVNIDRNLVPVDVAVRDYCALNGLDPLLQPTAGVMVAIVPRSQVKAALGSIQRSAYGANAAAIGTIEQLPAQEVIVN